MQSFYSVSPDKYSEKNLMESVRDIFSDCFPTNSAINEPAEEHVTWAKFDTAVPKASSNQKDALLLLFGTNRGFYIWSIAHTGMASLLYSRIGPFILSAELIPEPISGLSDYFYETRPLIATCYEQSHFQWEVQFVSLPTGSNEVSFTTNSCISSIDANQRFVLLGRIDCISVLSSHTLLELFTISNVKSVPKNMSFKCLPVALSARWLAFSDAKPVYHHMSRCGDASDDCSQPVATAMLNVNRRIWDSLSALASSVSIGSQSPGSHSRYSGQANRAPFEGHTPQSLCYGLPTQGAGDSSGTSGLSGVSASAGYVTIVDLVQLNASIQSQRLRAPYTSSEVKPSDLTHQCCLEIPRTQGESHLLRCHHTCSRRSPTDPSSVASLPDPHRDPVYVLSSRKDWVDVHNFSESGALVAHFLAHRWASVGYLEFDSGGSLLFTSCVQGHSFNVFRISNHPKDSRQTAVHHLYVLDRGSTSCEVVDACFSPDSRWLAASSNHGTTHIFPITPYGGPVSVRTHMHSHVVNRTSRYQRSSGLEEHHVTRPRPSRVIGVADAVTGSMGGKSAGSSSTGGTMSGAGTSIMGDQSFARFGSACKASSVQAHSSEGVQIPACPSIGATTGSGEESITSFIGQCACPKNAAYNTTNSRLPPFPEPCQVTPEARLRPRLPSHAMTPGYAALSAAATGALEVVNVATGGAPGGPPGYSVPTIHHLHHLPVNVSTTGSAFILPSGLRMAACFHPPFCFLPMHAHSRSFPHRKPHEKHGRFMDSAFVITWDMHLVQFDLCVGAADASHTAEKVHPESSIKLGCTPVGQWHLRADSILLPPFSDTHPLISRHQFARRIRTPTSSNTPSADVSTQTIEDNESQTHSPDSHSPTAAVDIPMVLVKHRPTSSSMPDTSSKQPITAAPEGWPKYDAASYWYSQVELTTHLGPLRRIWMGPQFSFKVYPPTDDLPGSDSYLYDPSMAAHGRQSPTFDGLTETTMASCQPCSYGESDYGSIEPFSTTSHSSRSLSYMINPLESQNEAKLRHLSAEGLSFPVTIIAGDQKLFTEGGSYQDSSLGGSLCSLVGRSADNVAQNLAEAMQEDESSSYVIRRPDFNCTATVVFPSPFLIRPRSPGSLSTGHSSCSPQPFGPVCRHLNLASARNSLFVLESDFSIQNVPQHPNDNIAASLNLLTEEAQNAEETKKHAIEESKATKDDIKTENVSTLPKVRAEIENEQIKAVEQVNYAESGVEMVIPGRPEIRFHPSANVAITTSLPQVTGVGFGSEESLSSSPSKSRNAITEPSEISTESSSGLKVPYHKKNRSSRAWKRTATLQKAKQLEGVSPTDDKSKQAPAGLPQVHVRKQRAKKISTLGSKPQATAPFHAKVEYSNVDDRGDSES